MTDWSERMRRWGELKDRITCVSAEAGVGVPGSEACRRPLITLVHVRAQGAEKLSALRARQRKARLAGRHAKAHIPA